MIYLIYWKNFCKCHNVPPPNSTIKINKLWIKKKEKCSPSLAIKEIQSKTMVRFYLTPV
jgi:hypothetical protein